MSNDAGEVEEGGEEKAQTVCRTPLDIQPGFIRIMLRRDRTRQSRR